MCRASQVLGSRLGGGGGSEKTRQRGRHMESQRARREGERERQGANRMQRDGDLALPMSDRE